MLHYQLTGILPSGEVYTYRNETQENTLRGFRTATERAWLHIVTNDEDDPHELDIVIDNATGSPVLVYAKLHPEKLPEWHDQVPTSDGRLITPFLR